MKTEFYIQRKLEYILPYLVCAERLNKSTQYYLYHSYNHSKELVAIASGIGLSGPIVNLFNAQTVEVGALSVAGVFGLGVVGLFRYIGGREELAKMMMGQNRLRNQSRALRVELNDAMQGDSAELVLQKLTVLQQKITGLINTAIQEDIWPFSPYTDVAAALAKEQAKKIMADLHFDTVSEAMAEQVPDQRI